MKNTARKTAILLTIFSMAMFATTNAEAQWVDFLKGAARASITKIPSACGNYQQQIKRIEQETMRIQIKQPISQLNTPYKESHIRTNLPIISSTLDTKILPASIEREDTLKDARMQNMQQYMILSHTYVMWKQRSDDTSFFTHMANYSKNLAMSASDATSKSTWSKVAAKAEAKDAAWFDKLNNLPFMK